MGAGPGDEILAMRVADAIGCRIIDGGADAPDWCDEHEAEWPCPQLNHALPLVGSIVGEALRRGWREGAVAMAQSYRDGQWITENNPYRAAGSS